MSEHLKDHIRKFVAVSDEDYDEILGYFSAIKAPKKQNLLVEGKVCKCN